MKWEELLTIVGREPVFHASLLLAGEVDTGIAVQLSRWVASGRLLQLRRGVYALAKPFRMIEPHPFAVAAALRKNSYVSLQSALAFHGLIPEHVTICTSVTTGRPERLETPLGSHFFKRIKPGHFFGFRRVEVESKQFAFVAQAEKALLDLVYLTPGADTEAYLDELRLQHPETIDPEKLLGFARRMEKPKLRRAARIIALLATRREGEG